MQDSGQGISGEVVGGPGRLAGEPRISRLADGGMRVVAPAKINLSLWVGRRGEDGYHPVKSLVAWIWMVDRLTVWPNKQGWEFTCSDPELACDQNNLVTRAARALAEREDRSMNLRVHLDKFIPVGAGLGGGSSDAAACLLALNALWGTGCSDDSLAEVGAELGSDVPLFLNGPISVVSGRGEKVEPLGYEWPFWAVIFVPGCKMGTARVYEKFDEVLTEPVDVDRIEGSQLCLCEPETAGAVMFNMLGQAARETVPELVDWQETLLAAGAGCVQMTGSGSGLFCLFNSLERARRVVSRLSPRLQNRVMVVHGGHH